MSDTPRTNDMEQRSQWLNVATREALGWKHARDLERELAIANARIDYLCSPDSSHPEVTTIINEIAAIADAVCDLQQHKRRGDGEPIITFDEAKLTLGTLRKARLIRDGNEPQVDK